MLDMFHKIKSLKSGLGTILLMVGVCMTVLQLSACGGGGGSTTTPPPTPTPTLTSSPQSISIAGYVVTPGVFTNTKTLQIPVGNPDKLTLTYSVATAPSKGLATISALSGILTYSLSVPSTASFDALQVRVTGTGNVTTLVDVSIQILPDPNVLTGSNVQDMLVLATGSGTMTSKTQQIVVSDPQNGTMSYAITTAPSKGVASINSSGVVTYSVSTLTNATSDSMAVNVYSSGRSMTVSMPITITTDPKAIIASDQSWNIEAFTAGTVSTTLQVLAKDPQSLPLTYAITQAPTKGNASISSSGLLTYSLTAPTTATADNLLVTVSNGSKSRVISVMLGIDKASNPDPLLPWQWHLINQNQYFSSTNPANNAGCDLNIHPSSARNCGGVVGSAGVNLWGTGVKGNNVNVTVVDTGMEIAHVDLADNVVAAGSYNFLTLTTNPTSTTTTGDHGTAVAGLIAAVGNNGEGVSGIAPKAKLRANNYLRSNQLPSEFSVAFGGKTNYGSFQSDVFNFSAGSESAYLYTPVAASAAVYENAALNLRGGKGAIVVKSAGNAFEGMYSSSTGLPTGTTTYCNYSGISCHNANNDDDNTVYSNIIVAAANADGSKTTYSSTGSPIWVTGFGGQRTYNSAYITSTTAANYKPALISTDQMGCVNGYVGSAKYNLYLATPSSTNPDNNAFNQHNGSVNNPNCNYTAGFNGTSAAAPTVVGVVALMLQANPNLTWRDVRHILATTARKISAAQAAVTNSNYFSPNILTLEQGWVTNAAGYAFHNYFGFGLIDATAAVAAAKTYVLGSLGTFTSRASNASLAGDLFFSSINGVGGITKTFNVSGLATVEQAELLFFPGAGYTPYCTQIELTSPANTKSILLNMDSGHTLVSSTTATGGTRFLSNAFYGEPAAGTWTLRLISRCSTPQYLSLSYPQQLTLRGH